MRGKAIAVICCLALLVGCTGCGALKESSRRERQSQQGQSSQQGERIASSLKDYARSLLDSDGGKISDQQKSALEKAASGGKVSQADYERAWADYKQCIIDKGYAEPTFDKYDNGTTYTMVFDPDENGHVTIPNGTTLEPMTLYALFETPSGTDATEGG